MLSFVKIQILGPIPPFQHHQQQQQPSQPQVQPQEQPQEQPQPIPQEDQQQQRPPTMGYQEPSQQYQNWGDAYSQYYYQQAQQQDPQNDQNFNGMYYDHNIQQWVQNAAQEQVGERYISGQEYR